MPSERTGTENVDIDRGMRTLQRPRRDPIRHERGGRDLLDSQPLDQPGHVPRHSAAAGVGMLDRARVEQDPGDTRHPSFAS